MAFFWSALKTEAFSGIISLTNQTDQEIDYHPEDFVQLVKAFNTNYQLIPDLIGKAPTDEKTIEKCTNYFH